MAPVLLERTLASLLHIAVGAAAGRALSGRRSLPASLLGVALSMLPDADVVAFVVGIPYAHSFGHRGATHSIAFAVSCGLLAAIVARMRGGHALRWGAGLGLVVLSHPLLDMLTTGGLGVALWWPVLDDRIFAPWRVIPVAPIGMGMLSRRGLWVILAELGPSLPMLFYALWPTPQSKA